MEEEKKEIITRNRAIELGKKYFYTGIECRNGHDSARYVNDGKCITCVNNRVNKYKNENKEKVYHTNKKYREKNVDVIRKKKQKYRIENRERIKQKYKEYYQHNKTNILKRNREYYIDNKEWIDQYYKEWRSNNKEYIKSYNDIYKAENREYILKQARFYAVNNKDKRKEYHYYRWNNDPEYRLIYFMRNSLKRMITKTSDVNMYDYNYNTTKLKKHIEDMFIDGMSWNNYGEWHIDHRISINYYLTQGITDHNIINSLDNLRPMWANDNLLKGIMTENEFFDKYPCMKLKYKPTTDLYNIIIHTINV